MVMMEGILWKWTNYLSGWQPRWFVLDYGVLAYYRSQDEMHLGSRGSVKMSCCEILINSNDPVRIDLKIPPENYMYLKAATAAERQKWLVALGTSKACLVEGNAEEQQQQLNSLSFVKDKMKELDLCRNIMMEQINQIKSLTTDHRTNENKALVEAGTLLSATCDAFSNNLDDIMEIIEDNLSTFSGSPVSTPRLHKPPHHSHKHKRVPSTPTTPTSTSSPGDSLSDIPEENGNSTSSVASESSSSKQSSIHSLATPEKANLPSLKLNLPITAEAYKARDFPLKDIIKHPDHGPLSHLDSSSVSSVSSISSVASSFDNSSQLQQLRLNEHDNGKNENIEMIDSSPENLPLHPVLHVGKSFFGQAPTRFEDIEITSSGLIPTKMFLDACSSIVPVLDSFGATAFAPVKMDIQGNIQKIQLKFETDRQAFEYLQNIVSLELKSNKHTARNSSTDALLWLKRALEFILIFLSEITKGEKDLSAAAGTAYSKSLRKYHGWIVRGVFNLAVKACPYYEDFIKALSGMSKGFPASEHEILSEMSLCVEALNKVVSKLSSYYKKNKLDSDTIV